MMNKEEFIQLLQDKKYKTAQNILSEMNDMDTAAFLEELDAKECALAFRLISKEKAADVFSCMNSKMQTFLVDMFSETELKELLDDLYMDDTVDMLEDLPANLVTRILKNLDSTKRSTINKLLSSKKINFERRSTKITEDSNIVVKEIAKILQDNPSFKIEIAGHTDSRGSDSLNKQISQDRASSVRDVLISLGIDKNRVTAIGYGEEFPIAQDDENGLSEINRRVEFNILGE